MWVSGCVYMLMGVVMRVSSVFVFVCCVWSVGGVCVWGVCVWVGGVCVLCVWWVSVVYVCGVWCVCVCGVSMYVG